MSRRTQQLAASRRAFARRQWARRWRILRRVLAVLVVAGLVGGAAWLVFASSVLAVASVEVRGNSAVAADRVRDAADVSLGIPLARVDVGDVRQRVSALPPVERVEVGRSWPHTLTIRVVERVPVAVVHLGGRHALVDRHGVLFRDVPAPRPGLPVIEAGSTASAAEAAEVVDALPASLGERLAGMEARTRDSITLRLRSGRTVVWGSAAHSDLKAEVTAALLEQDGQVLDVSVPSTPTIR